MPTKRGIAKSANESFQKFKNIFTKEGCYKRMEAAGEAYKGVCNGQWGGDEYTAWLAYSCTNCKYYEENQPT